MTGEIPLVGRGVELDRIVAELTGVDPVAFVLAGAAGAGKTRLAAEAATAARASARRLPMLLPRERRHPSPSARSLRCFRSPTLRPAGFSSCCARPAKRSSSEPATANGSSSWWMTPTCSMTARPRWSTSWCDRGARICCASRAGSSTRVAPATPRSSVARHEGRARCSTSTLPPGWRGRLLIPEAASRQGLSSERPSSSPVTTKRPSSCSPAPSRCARTTASSPS
jgi:hypothetical protein